MASVNSACVHAHTSKGDAATAAAAPAAPAAAAAAAASSPSAAVLAIYSADADEFFVETKADASLLLQGPHDLLLHNAELLKPIIVRQLQQPSGQSARQSRISAACLTPQLIHHAAAVVSVGDVSFVVRDNILQMLHTLLELHKLLLQHPSATLSVFFLSKLALHTTALQLLAGHRLPPSSIIPVAQPLLIDGKPSQLRVHFCKRWAVAAAAVGVRALWIPALNTHLGEIASEFDCRVLVQQLLSYFPRAQLFPPLSWDDLFEHKEKVYELFGSAHMLPACWLSLSSPESAHAVASKLLQGRADGAWVVKGSSSWAGRTVSAICIRSGGCAKLPFILAKLYSQFHQRCVGIQPYDAGLRHQEQRVFLVPDAASSTGWRQCLSARTFWCNGSITCQLELPTHGVALSIARFVDSLLVECAAPFRRALELRIPLLRLDCGFSQHDQRCFLSELCCAGDVNLFTRVHWQDLAYVCGRSFAKELWDLASESMQ